MPWNINSGCLRIFGKVGTTGFGVTGPLPHPPRQGRPRLGPPGWRSKRTISSGAPARLGDYHVGRQARPLAGLGHTQRVPKP